MVLESKLQLAGLVGGAALAPLTALGSYVRRSRLFHPCGICLRGEARPVEGADAFQDAGSRLAGRVLVRFSGAWWKSRQWPDVLGCALRFTGEGPLGGAPRASDQDLLLATIRNPLTTLLAPVSTNVDDYMSNAYFGVSPFQIAPKIRVKLRLSPLQTTPSADTRDKRILRALACGPLALMLEARPDRLGARYRPVARIEFVERVDLDERALRFDPFATGRGFVPTGLVHALRVASYAASRRARDAATA
jgi:hypothetical protein